MERTLEPDRFDNLSSLCCCEYYDRNNQRYHILECCCNCVDFDEAFERLICCQRVPDHLQSGMLLTFQDRLRIPCRGGAKQISLEALVPIVAIPLIIGLSAVNLYCLIILSVTAVFSLGYFFFYVRKTKSRTRFFYIWTLASIIYLLILFEAVVPLLEILPEENAIMFVFVILSLILVYKVKQKSRLQQLDGQSKDASSDGGVEDTAILIERGQEESDSSDHSINRQQNTCPLCLASMSRFDHHSYVLDCCIGQANHKQYFFALLFGILALILGANLTLTSVCHPFLLFRLSGVHVLLPDDCSEVYDQYDISLSFVLSVYTLILAFFALVEFAVQIFAISKGVTLNECCRGRRKSLNGNSILVNWKNFLC